MVVAIIFLAVVALGGLAIATRLPANPRQTTDVARSVVDPGALDTVI